LKKRRERKKSGIRVEIVFRCLAKSKGKALDFSSMQSGHTEKKRKKLTTPKKSGEAFTTLEKAHRLQKKKLKRTTKAIKKCACKKMNPSKEKKGTWGGGRALWKNCDLGN